MSLPPCSPSIYTHRKRGHRRRPATAHHTSIAELRHDDGRFCKMTTAITRSAVWLQSKVSYFHHSDDDSQNKNCALYNRGRDVHRLRLGGWGLGVVGVGIGGGDLCCLHGGSWLSGGSHAYVQARAQEYKGVNAHLARVCGKSNWD